MAMLNRHNLSLRCLGALTLVLALPIRQATALQRLEVFAAGAREKNPSSLEASANLRERGAEADFALGRVLPGVSFTGEYDRNQYTSSVDLSAFGGPSQTILLLPKNAWTGTGTLTVPLVNLANFQRIAAARSTSEGAAFQFDATRLQVEANVALVAAANDSLQVSREALRLAQERLRAGTAAVLEVDRARADVEQRVQQL